MDLSQKARHSKLLLKKANELAAKHQFIDAISIAGNIIDEWYPTKLMAESLFRNSLLGGFLKQVNQKIRVWEPKAELEYKAVVKSTYWLVTEGRFQEAITLLEPVNSKFFKPSGKKLIDKLYQIIAGRDSFDLGLLAEQTENFDTAIEHYENTIRLSPEWKNECRIRLGIIAIKSKKWLEAVSQVEGIKLKQAAYILVIAYAKLGDLQKAQQQLNLFADEDGRIKTRDIEQLQQGEHNFLKLEIQQFVNAGNIQEARSSSINFIQQFCDDPLVQENLSKHILPRLEITCWQNQDWEELAQISEERWLDRTDIATLHNWALANYYLALANPRKLNNLIVAWSTAVANLHLNPLLQNISWLGDTALNLDEVSTQLKQHLENLLDALEQKDLEEYTRLRELYRLEVVTLDLMGTPPTNGLRARGLFLTPGYYQRNSHKLKVPPLPGKLWAALYTDWWRAILACMDGDIFRAVQMKPEREPCSNAERFAQSFLSYHQGCYYLEIVPEAYPRWRSAVEPLRQAKSEIRASSQWSTQIDRLCEKHYQALWDNSDRRQFTRFWYDLVESPAARSYLK